ncbi:hypothetical protein SDC9_108697 [bioreactor metagenome]|uniref:HTH tetR-type domain-containing protein n=1 Tax=bioreactor metagenome TaxID=1076179 RepID=A0A645BJB6_9ZZZZ|nr:TetR/AcrR family transcriptional regulator [Erysipelotrichaceae bacterium]
MPRSFTDSERAYLQQRLQDEALNCLVLYGVKKTTVDELVKRVKMPKGTFYLFYPFKEALFFEVILQYHDKVQQRLQNLLAENTLPPTIDSLTELLLKMYQEADSDLLRRLLTGEDLELIIRKLPPEMTQEHLEHDDFSISQLLAQIPGAQKANAELYSAAFRAVFLMLLHKKEIGESFMDETMRLLIKGLMIQLFHGDHND